MLTVTVVTATLSFNVLPLTLATAIYLFIQYFKRVTYLAQRPVYHMAL